MVSLSVVSAGVPAVQVSTCQLGAEHAPGTKVSDQRHGCEPAPARARQVPGRPRAAHAAPPARRAAAGGRRGRRAGGRNGAAWCAARGMLRALCRMGASRRLMPARVHAQHEDAQMWLCGGHNVLCAPRAWRLKPRERLQRLRLRQGRASTLIWRRRPRPCCCACSATRASRRRWRTAPPAPRCRRPPCGCRRRWSRFCRWSKMSAGRSRCSAGLRMSLRHALLLRSALHG